MTKTQSHAKSELDILAKQTPDAVVLEFTPQILALCEAFGKSGQSGGSAPFVSKAIVDTLKKLLNFDPICPLTGDESEWSLVSMGDNEPIYQNNRYPRVFKAAKDGRAYFIDAIVFDGDIAGRFNGQSVSVPGAGNIASRQYIKSFPFTPKTFYIDVLDMRWKDKNGTQLDENGDWWTHTVKDPNQLKEVFEYYDKMR